MIQDFIEPNPLYEDSLHHSCVFVGRDGAGKPVFASKRGTCDLGGSSFKRDAPGSDTSAASSDPDVVRVRNVLGRWTATAQGPGTAATTVTAPDGQTGSVTITVEACKDRCL